MATNTVPTVTIFDQHDLTLIAQRQLQFIMARCEQPDLMLLIKIGRALTSNEPVAHDERVQLYTLMMTLRLKGIVIIPAVLMNHHTGRVQVYEHICKVVFNNISKQGI